MRECRFFQPKLLLLLALFTGIGLTACSSHSRQKHLVRGAEHLQKRQFQAAMIEFRAANELDKDSAEAHWGLARAFENLGQYDETLGELRETVRLAPDNLEAKAKLGTYYLVAVPPNTAEAEKLVADIFARDANFIEGYILKASLFAAQKRSAAEVLGVLNQALGINPNRTETYLSFARYYVKINRPQEAEKAIQKGIEVNPNAAVGYLEYGRFLSYAARPAEAEAQFVKAAAVEPESIEARQSLAEFYSSQKQFDRAETAYRQLVEMQQNSPESLLDLANFYAAAGRSDEAIRTFGAILQDKPEYARARYRLGEIYLERGENQQALEQTAELLKSNDADITALMLRARVSLQQNKSEAAVKDLEEILKQQPTQRDALFYMAQARLALGQIEQARAFVGDLEKYHPAFLKTKLLKIQASFADGDADAARRQANELLDALKNIYPNQENDARSLEEMRERALTARGLANLELGSVAAARADLQTVQNLSPNSAAALVNLAKVAAAERNRSEAANLYERALTANQRNFDALNGLVSLLIKQKQFDVATSRINRVIETAAPEDLAALHYLNANVYTARNDAPAAEAELKKAIELDGTYLPAYSSYAAMLMARNDANAAIEQYRKIVEKKPSGAIYTLIGMLEEGRNNAAEAEKNYRRALEVTPDSPIAANNLAWLIADNQGNLDEALTLSQKAVNSNGSVAGYYDTLGWIYYKKELYSPSVEQFKKAVALDQADAAKNGVPANSAYRLRLGMALASLGDKSSARREIESSLQNANNLNEKEAREARNLLASL